MTAWQLQTAPEADDAPRAPRLHRALGGFAALAALGGLLALLVGTYSSFNAGASGVPLIRADLNPTRVRPEQPGGMNVPHQDRLILAQGGSRGLAVQLVPPPEAPIPETNLEAMIEAAPPPTSIGDLIAVAIPELAPPPAAPAGGEPELLIGRAAHPASAIAAVPPFATPFDDEAMPEFADTGPDTLESLINRALREDVQIGRQGEGGMQLVSARNAPPAD